MRKTTRSEIQRHKVEQNRAFNQKVVRIVSETLVGPVKPSLSPTEQHIINRSLRPVEP